MHTIAAYFPDSPSEEKKESVKHFIGDVARVFPCHDCASDFQHHIADHPPKVENRQELSLWMCEAHNHVNDRLGKELFDCKKVDLRWRYEHKK